jgi:tetratricopeptide (TPR) repeat protein
VIEEKELYEIASAYYNGGRYKASETIFRYLTEIRPFIKPYWKGVAASCYMQASYKEALAAYTTASCMDKAEQDPYCPAYAAECHFKLGDYEKAITALDKAIAIASRNLSSNSLMEELELLQNRWKTYGRTSTSLSKECPSRD